MPYGACKIVGVNHGLLIVSPAVLVLMINNNSRNAKASLSFNIYFIDVKKRKQQTLILKIAVPYSLVEKPALLLIRMTTRDLSLTATLDFHISDLLDLLIIH